MSNENTWHELTDLYPKTCKKIGQQGKGQYVLGLNIAYDPIGTETESVEEYDLDFLEGKFNTITWDGFHTDFLESLYNFLKVDDNYWRIAGIILTSKHKHSKKLNPSDVKVIGQIMEDFSIDFYLGEWRLWAWHNHD